MQTVAHEHFSAAVLLVLFQSTTVMLFQSYYAYGSDCEGRFILNLLHASQVCVNIPCNMHALLQ